MCPSWSTRLFNRPSLLWPFSLLLQGLRRLTIGTGCPPKTQEFWLEAHEQRCNVMLLIVPHQRQRIYADVILTVYAPSHLLSQVPYFAAGLSEPWCAIDERGLKGGCARRKLTVQCCDASVSPADYRLCLQFLQPHHDFVIPSIDVALRVLRAADHLLFRGCADACMAFLAAVPWSPSEHKNIQQAISSMGFKASTDLAAKLEPSEADAEIVKDFLLSAAQSARKRKDCRALKDLIRYTMLNAPQEVAKIWTSALMDAWVKLRCWEYTKEFFIALIGALLQYGDAKEVIQTFVLNSETLASAEFCQHLQSNDGFLDILTEIFLRSIPAGEQETMILLSNSQRASLVATWVPIVAKLSKNRNLIRAFQKVVYSLPPQDPLLIKVVKENYDMPSFKPYFTWWSTSLLKRMKLSDFAHEETTRNKEIVPTPDACCSMDSLSYVEENNLVSRMLCMKR